MKENQHLRMAVGDYQKILILVYNDDEELYPLSDLNDGVLDWYLYQPPDYDTSLIHKQSSGQGITVPDDGNVVVELKSTNTANLDYGKYYHKLTFTTVIGEESRVKTVADGTFTLLKDASQYFRQTPAR